MEIAYDRNHMHDLDKVLNTGMKLGGLGKTMEIDELKFSAKRKYKRVRASEGLCAFGVVE